MNDRNLISIIIPVYNGQRYIGACLESIVNQTYVNIEVIVINDGSKDKTADIIGEWSKKDNRIKLIHKQNEGVSVARNVGISASKGEYVLFVDSDDNLKNTAIEELLVYMDGQNYDLILFGFCVTGNSNRENDTHTLKQLISIPKSEIKKNMIKSIISTTGNIYGYIWRAMYSTKMLKVNGVLFPEGIKISEDYLFLLNAVRCSENFYVTPAEYYIYNLGESSMSTKYIPTLLDDMVYVNNWMYNNIVKEDQSLLEGYYCSVSNTYLRYVQNTMRNRNKTFWEKRIEIKDNKQKFGFQQVLNKVWCKPKKFNFKSKVGIILFQFHMDWLYEVIFELKERVVR